MSPTLDNFKFLIMMNQKEMNAQKEPVILKEGIVREAPWLAHSRMRSVPFICWLLVHTLSMERDGKPPGQNRRRRKGRQETM